MAEHIPTAEEKAKAEKDKQDTAAKATMAASAKPATKDVVRAPWSMTSDEFATFRADETKLNPDSTQPDWFGTNRERWEMERRSAIVSARDHGEAVPANILKDFVMFDGKPQTIYIDGFAVSIQNASVGAQIKRNEQFPTQAALYEWKATVDGQTYEGHRAVTMEELVAVASNFIHNLPHAARDASKAGHWSTQKPAVKANAPARS